MAEIVEKEGARFANAYNMARRSAIETTASATGWQAGAASAVALCRHSPGLRSSLSPPVGAASTPAPAGKMNSATLTIGTVRNLTPQFKRMRDEQKRNQEQIDQDKAGPLLDKGFPNSSKDPEAAAGANRTSPAWMLKSERIRVEMSALKESLSKLKECHSRALKVTFDGDDQAHLEAETLTSKLRLGFKRLNDDIKSMNDGTAAEDTQVREQVQRQLGRALMAMTREFRGEETRYLTKLEEQKGFDPGSSYSQLETAMGDSETAAEDERDPGFKQDQINVVDTMNKIAEERGQEIQVICENIAELASIMRDMATLVVEQGTILDRIDHNIQEVFAKTEKGAEIIKDAEGIQKKSQFFLCIIALIVIVVVMLIIVIVRQSLK